MKVTGVDKLLKQFDQFGKEGEKVARVSVRDAAHDISGIAKRIAPKNLGASGLEGKIAPQKVTDLSWEVVSGAEYAGYVEFGTGSKVVVPKEMQDMANAIRGKKGGNIDEALKSIKQWCRDKGIDERAAWPILMSILDEGLRPQPYLYPAFIQGGATFRKNLFKALLELSKKFNAQK